VLEHDQRGGNIFELLADLLADALAKLAAVGAGSLLRGHLRLWRFWTN
jgi:hypothetical protein